MKVFITDHSKKCIQALKKFSFLSRTRDEIQEVRQTRDPITGFREKLVASGLADQDELKAIEVI